MSCKDLIPEIKIQDISVKQVVSSPSLWLVDSLVPDPDEAFQLTISHENLIKPDEIKEFSLSEIINATVGSSNFYNIKVLLTNNPDKFELIKEMANLAEQVSFYSYGDSGEAATTNDMIEVIKNTPSNAPAEVKEAVEKVNACVFKLSGIDKETELDIVEAAPPAEIPATIPNLLPAAINLIQPQSSPILPALVETSQFALSLTARVLKALTDNNYNNIKPETDNIMQMVVPLEVDQKQITYGGDPLSAQLINQQELLLPFKDSQLKDLYAMVIPNVEYREGEKLIFTIRNYLPLTLVENYAATEFLPGQETNIKLLNQEPVINFEDIKDQAEFQYLTKYANDNLKSNLNPIEPFLSEPIVSIGYNKQVNGVFFLDQKTFAKNLTTFHQVLKKPETFAQYINKITVKKIYKNGTEKVLETPQAFNGLSFNNDMIVGYHFTDSYDAIDFKYEIQIDAKNPLEKPLRSLIKESNKQLKILDQLIKQIESGQTQAKTLKGGVTILNPNNGVFTDDFLASEYYEQYNATFQLIRASLYQAIKYLSNFQAEPYKNDLSSLKELTDIRFHYDEYVKTLYKIADTEGINVQDASSYSSKKKGQGSVPYKTLTKQFNKPYISKEASVYYDFLNQARPNGDGFFVNPFDLRIRVENEEQMLGLFNTEPDTTTTFGSTEAIALTPTAITIDNSTIDLLLTNEEERENTATRALLSAELEAKDPTRNYRTESDVFLELLSAEGVTLENPNNKQLTVVNNDKDYIPSGLTARPRPTGKKLKKKNTVLEEILKGLAATAKKELADKTAKSLYLDNADLDFNAILLKYLIESLQGNIPSKKHGQIMQQLGEAAYKQNPASFVTRLLNAYQIEVLTGFENNSIKNPVFSPLTKEMISNSAAGTSMLVRLGTKGVMTEIDVPFTIVNEAFLLTTAATIKPIKLVQQIIPVILDIPFVKIDVSKIALGKLTIPQITTQTTPPVAPPLGQITALGETLSTPIAESTPVAAPAAPTTSPITIDTTGDLGGLY